MTTTYKIIRFYRDDRPKVVVERGLTREEAQAHCQDPATRASDGSWFEGFEADTEEDDQ